MDVEVKKENQNTQLKDHEVKELIKNSQNGDQKARDLLIEKNMRLVWSVVQRFLNRGYEPDDLFQIGCIGLLKSVDKFDLSYDVRFSTYAVPMIIGEIQRFIRDDGTVKVSRSLKELGNKIRRAKDEPFQVKRPDSDRSGNRRLSRNQFRRGRDGPGSGPLSLVHS